jgi:hypothetical protein
MSVTKEALYNLVDTVEKQDYGLVYQLLLRFVPMAQPLADEILAIEEARKSIAEHGTVRFEDIDWE